MIDLKGTLRECTAQETLQRITPLLWEKFGITRAANITGLDNIGLPVYTAIRPNSKNLSVSQGKGLNNELAKVSALMEAIEIAHAEEITNVKFTGSFNELTQKNSVIDPRTLVVPEAMEQINDTPLRWVPCLELFSQSTVYLPEMIFLLDTTQLTELNLAFAPSTNGLASGNSRAEAICHALCELIERDAVTRWFELTEIEQDQTLIRLDTITPRKIKQLIQQITNSGLNVYIWDVTAANQVPSYYCALTDDRRQPFTLFSGSGSHFNAEIALLRALTEVAQARLTYISGSRDDIFPDYYRDFDPTPAVVELKQTHPNKDYSLIATPEFENFEAANQYLLTQLQGQQVTQVFLYDHTRDDINIPVIHLISPQLLRATE
jgi:ribosomal protein S12 methylthiotransferase accessory factor